MTGENIGEVGIQCSHPVLIPIGQNVVVTPGEILVIISKHCTSCGETLITTTPIKVSTNPITNIPGLQLK